MFRLWGKLWKDNHMLKDLVIDDDSEDTRTHKIFRALQEICYDFDQEYFSDSSGVCVLADFLCGIQDRNGGETSDRICIVF